MKKIICKLHKFFNNRQYINLPKTFLANFMLLDFSDAIKFPIIIYGKCKLFNLSGKIVFTDEVKTGMLKIGISDAVRSYHNKSFIDIGGILQCGASVVLRKGVKLRVFKTGQLILHRHVYIGDNNTLIARNIIEIGNSTRVGNDTTFMDTDFHFIVNTNNGIVKSYNGEIRIGENNWIGGNCIIKKGSKTPKGTILAGPFSMISKDYTNKIAPFSIIGGSPAKLLIEGMRRINNEYYEQILVRHFMKTTEPYQFSDVIDFDKICMPD